MARTSDDGIFELFQSATGGSVGKLSSSARAAPTRNVEPVTTTTPRGPTRARARASASPTELATSPDTNCSDLARIDAAAQGRSDEHAMACHLFQTAQHGAPVFGIERAKDQRDLLTGFDVTEHARIERVGQGDGAVRVVRAVEQGQLLAAAVEQLVAPRPGGLLDALRHDLGRDAELARDR